MRLSLSCRTYHLTTSLSLSSKPRNHSSPVCPASSLSTLNTRYDERSWPQTTPEPFTPYHKLPSGTSSSGSSDDETGKMSKPATRVAPTTTVTPATSSESKAFIPAKTDIPTTVDHTSSSAAPAPESAADAEPSKTTEGTNDVVDAIGKLDLTEKKDEAVVANDADGMTGSEDVKQTCVRVPSCV